jgi:phosphonate degradation associated HDIG domain protein
VGLSLADIDALFAQHGHIEYSGEPVTQLEHALQCAQLAESEGGSAELITASLLHDLGHMLNRLGDTPSARGIDDQHQYFSIPFLRPLFPPAVIEPIRMHVDAKRALCALDPGYYDALSADSKRSLALQGGTFAPEAARAFAAKTFARDAMRLRRWDDHAKTEGRATPPLAYYLDIAASCAFPGRGAQPA